MKAPKTTLRIGGVFAAAGAWLLLGCQCAYWPPPSSEKPQAYTEPVERPSWMAYDDAFADAVQAHWLQLLEDRIVPQDNGRVVLHLVLNSQGEMSELDMLENTEGEVFGALCQKAVQDLVPYREWTAEMCSLFGETRSFQVVFEFDEGGLGRLAYAEDWVLLARNHRAPSETYIVLSSAKRKRGRTNIASTRDDRLLPLPPL